MDKRTQLSNQLMRFMSKIMRRSVAEYRQALWFVNQRFRKSVTMRTKQGIFRLPTSVNDPISRELFIYREYELNLISSATAFIREYRGIPHGKGTILDIGANNGVISIGMLVRGIAARAIAIEPDPRNFVTLQHNIALNQLENAFTALNYAVSDSKSTLQFELSATNFGDHRVRTASSLAKSAELFGESNRQVIHVEADTVDNLLAALDENVYKDIFAVWIDVQGYEGYVFKGAEKLLKSGIPVVAEIWPYAIQRAGMTQEAFCEIIGNIWTSYWVWRKDKFVQYPIEVFYTFFAELGNGRNFENVIFTR
ncbi:MAG: FkbM family methyltransferase [Anaerolineales bacterium]|nr:FkbM family methyltransferase [Anaerolineales bacterium]